MNAALILSGGAGRRFGSALPKQYHKIGGRTVIEYVLDAAANARLVDRVMVAGADCPQLRALAGRYAFDRAPAGAVRNETLRHGLDALNALGCARVVILDAVRPLVTPELLDEYLRLIGEGWDAVSTVQPITDSLGCLDAHEVDRSRYYLMQSPEAYNFPLLYAHFRPDSPAHRGRASAARGQPPVPLPGFSGEPEADLSVGKSADRAGSEGAQGEITPGSLPGKTSGFPCLPAELGNLLP